MYAKLHWEFGELRERMRPNEDLMGPRLVAFAAFNFAVTAWHLTDWSLGEVYEERLDLIHEQLVAPAASDLSQLNSEEKRRRIGKALMQKYNCLRVCHDLANGDKHRGLSRPQCAHLSAALRWHRASDDREDHRVGFSIAITEGDVQTDAVTLFKDVIRTWRRLLSGWGLIEDPTMGVWEAMQEGKDEFGDPLPE